MKKVTIKIILLSTLVIFVGNSSAEQQPFVFNGVFQVGEKQMFSLGKQDGSDRAWTKIGASYEGYVLKHYLPKENCLIVERDDQEFRIYIAAASNESHSLEKSELLTEADKLMEAMEFDKMMDLTMEAQKKGMEDMMRQMVQSMSPGKEIDEAMIAEQSEMMGEFYDAMDWKTMKKDMAKIYQDVFTIEELNGITHFYNTPAGKATIEKSPELTQKTMEVIMPQMTEVMLEITNKRAQDSESKASDN